MTSIKLQREYLRLALRHSWTCSYKQQNAQQLFDEMSRPEKNPKLNETTESIEQRNWLDLPDDVTSNILKRVGVAEILESAQKVCTVWRRICKDPAMWRVIDMENLGDGAISHSQLEKLCMQAIHRSQGQLVEINVEYFPTIQLIEFLAQGERSSQLRRLQISHCYGSLNKSWSDFLEKAPLLEEFALTFTTVSEGTVADVSRHCPMLKSFIYNNYGWKYSNSADDFVIAFAKGMPQLLHLQLTGSTMTSKGLQAVLDGCPNLESLDLRGCFNINLGESCGKLCKEQIKNLRLPGDSMEGHKVAPYTSDSEDEYEYVWDDYDGISDGEVDFSGVVAEYYSLL